MKDSKGYIRARRGDPFLAHTPIPPEAHQGADPATPPPSRQSLPEPPARRTPWRGEHKNTKGKTR